LDLRATAKDYQTATQVQVNLEDPSNKIFEKADIINIQCNNQPIGPDVVKAQYPCTIQLRALFAKDSSFTFISKNPGTGANQ